MDEILFNEVKQQVPYLFYKRFHLQNAANQREFFTPQLPEGYGFLLREIFFKAGQERVPDTQANFYMELTQKVNGNVLQLSPYPIDLISTPGQGGVTVFPVISAHDNKNFGRVMTATAPKNRIILNIYYTHHEIVEFVLRETTGLDVYADVVLFGYLLPGKNLQEE